MTSEYPASIWVPAHESNYMRANRQPRDIEHIVIHCTDGRANARPVAEMWQEPRNGSSAHFVIGQDGLVIQAVQIADVAYHAHAVNHSSIGIEHSARTPYELGKDDPGLPPSQVQYAASSRLVAWLLMRCGLGPTRWVIQGHAEADKRTTHSRCPIGCGWDWDRYMELVKTAYEGLQVPG